MEVDNVFVPANLGKLKVTYEDGDFFVETKGTAKKINRFDVSRELRGLPPQSLKKVLELGSLRLTQIGKDYGLQYHVNGNGGDPWLAAGTFVVCWGTTIAATVASIPGGPAAVIGVFYAGSAATVTATAYAALAPTP